MSKLPLDIQPARHELDGLGIPRDVRTCVWLAYQEGATAFEHHLLSCGHLIPVKCYGNRHVEGRPVKKRRCLACRMVINSAMTPAGDERPSMTSVERMDDECAPPLDADASPAAE